MNLYDNRTSAMLNTISDKGILFQPFTNLKLKRNCYTPYTPFFSQSEMSIIINYYAMYKGYHVYNASNYRIDTLVSRAEHTLVHVSAVTYYDFLCSNALLINGNDILKYVYSKDIRLAKKLESFIGKYTSINTMDDILNACNLANPIAISILIKDATNCYGIIKRSNNTAISANYYGVTVSGCFESVDMESRQPIAHCVARETYEELGLHVELDDIHIHGIAFSRDKLQPIFLCDALIDGNWDELISTMVNAKDYQSEIQHFFSIPKDRLMLVKQYKMTEAAQVHVDLNLISSEPVYEDINTYLCH